MGNQLPRESTPSLEIREFVYGDECYMPDQGTKEYAKRRQSAQETLNRGGYVRTVLLGGRPVAFMGCIPDGADGANIWYSASTESVHASHPVRFLRASRAVVVDWLEHYRFLYGELVDPSPALLRWVRFMGGTHLYMPSGVTSFFISQCANPSPRPS